MKLFHNSLNDLLGTACCFSLFLCGCSRVDPLEARSQEFAYTAESLAEEIVSRLQMTQPKGAAPVSNPRADEVARMEADRGSDGDRPDPNSVEAIVLDTVAKLQQMARVSGEKFGYEVLVEELKANEQVDRTLRDDFIQQLEAAFQPTSK